MLTQEDIDFLRARTEPDFFIDGVPLADYTIIARIMRDDLLELAEMVLALEWADDNQDELDCPALYTCNNECITLGDWCPNKWWHRDEWLRKYRARRTEQ